MFLNYRDWLLVEFVVKTNNTAQPGLVWPGFGINDLFLVKKEIERICKMRIRYADLCLQIDRAGQAGLT